MSFFLHNLLLFVNVTDHEDFDRLFADLRLIFLLVEMMHGLELVTIKRGTHKTFSSWSDILSHTHLHKLILVVLFYVTTYLLKLTQVDSDRFLAFHITWIVLQKGCVEVEFANSCA